MLRKRTSYQLTLAGICLLILVLGIFVITREEAPIYIISGWSLFLLVGWIVTYIRIFLPINPGYVGLLFSILTTVLTIIIFMLFNAMAPNIEFPLKLLVATISQLVFAGVTIRLGKRFITSIEPDTLSTK